MGMCVSQMALLAPESTIRCKVNDRAQSRNTSKVNLFSMRIRFRANGTPNPANLCCILDRETVLFTLWEYGDMRAHLMAESGSVRQLETSIYDSASLQH